MPTAHSGIGPLKTIPSQHLAGVHDARGIQSLLDLPHQGDFGRAARIGKIIAFQGADAVFGEIEPRISRTLS